MPVERWAEIEGSIDRLRPLATEALLAIFGQRMSAQSEAAFGKLTRELSQRDAPEPQGPAGSAAAKSGAGAHA
jgi:hypothetical protein